MLAQSAQVADGKLNLLGGGWNITGPDPEPMAIALLLEVPWDRANEPHAVKLELLDADGLPVTVDEPDGDGSPIEIDVSVEVGRPPGMIRGTPLNVPLAMNLAPHQLPTGTRCEWRLTINGESQDGWRVAFSVRPSS